MAHLLFIGAGRFQLPVIEEALSRGCRVSAIDGDVSAPGLRRADEAIALDIRDSAACLHEARRLQPDAVIAPITEAGLPSAAAIAEALGLPGLGIEAARRATNKAAMREAFARAGLASTGYALCHRLDEAGAAYRALGPEVVVKPATGAGSRGVSFVSDIADMVERFSVAKAASPDGAVLVEAFMPGPEVAVEGYISGGEFTALLVSDKTRSAPPALLDTSIVYPSRHSEAELAAITELAEAGVRALGIDDAPIHAEIILTQDGPRLVEIAARGAGFHVFNQIVPAVTGVDTPALQVDLALGIPVCARPSSNAAARLDFPACKPGRVERIEGLEAVRAMAGVLFAECFVAPGGKVRTLTSGSDRAAAIAVAAPNHDAADKLLERARGTLRIETVAEESAAEDICA